MSAMMPIATTSATTMAMIQCVDIPSTPRILGERVERSLPPILQLVLVRLTGTHLRQVLAPLALHAWIGPPRNPTVRSTESPVIE